METGQTTVQESALHAGRQAWWPLDTMACSLDDDASTISSSFLLGWDPQLCYFGLGAMGAGAADSGTHAGDLELFVPKCVESPSPVSEASTAVSTGWTMHKDATAMTTELDELLMSLWDSDKEHAVGISSCSALNEASATSSQYGDHSDQLSSIILPTLPTSPDKTPAPAQAELSPSLTSRCNVDLQTSDTGGAPQPRQTTDRANSSSKRSAPEGAEGGESSKRSRKQAPCSTAAAAGGGARTVAAYPFAVVKPGGEAGSVTLADINRWILTPPARPVRHPVGEFACAPRLSAGGNRPSPSGRTVAGFTRLHTAGKGTITIVRTRG